MFLLDRCLVPALLAALTTGACGQAQSLPRKLPAGLTATLFAAPPMVNYPTFVAATPHGELFVSVDKNGSLDAKPDRGFIYKLVDVDGDGKADKRTVFSDKVTSARGLAVDGDTVYCLHPPELELFRDKDGDGIAEERKVLVKGIGFDLSKRPPDHTSNGVTLGIDGWLYLAIGDFGFMEAEGTDGRKLQLCGGGVVRVRPDGTEMELFTSGTRNIYGVAVDPWLNLFARDNTNDGGGWDTRVEYYAYGADLGYPRKFKHFTDETFPVLGIYGGGSGVGGCYLQEKGFGWPAGYDDVLYTCDWGRSAVYRHPLKDQGASFGIEQDTFCELERVTDMSADANGHVFLASWKGASFTYAGENVGYIVRVGPEKPSATRFDLNLKAKNEAALVRDLTNPRSHVLRLAAQREILRRKPSASLLSLLETGAQAGDNVPARIAALFTLKQAAGAGANGFLTKLAGDGRVREFALRALADRPAQAKDVPTETFTAHLKDPNDHVKAQAAIALSRLGRTEAADALLSIAARQAEPAAESAAGSADAKPKASTGIIRKSTPGRAAVMEANIAGAKMLHLVVTDAGDGNGTDHAVWMEPRISGPTGEKKLTELPWASVSQGWGKTLVNQNCTGGAIKVDGKPVAYGIGTHAVSVISYKLPPGFAKFTAKGGMEDTGTRQGNGGSVQFQVFVDDLPAPLRATKNSPQGGDSSEQLYTDTTRALPHLASRALIALKAGDACLKALDSEPSRHAAALRVLRQLHEPEVVSGLLQRLPNASPAIQQGIATALIRLYFTEGVWDGSSWGTRPDTTGPYYKRDAWSETPRIEKALAEVLANAGEPMKRHLVAQLQKHHVQIKGAPVAAGRTDPQWAKDQDLLLKAMQETIKMKPGDIGMLEPHLAVEKALARLSSGKADPDNGGKLFTRQGCAACHATGKNDPPKGPNLFDIAQRYKPEEIMTSILNPSATVSQGFPTHTITTKDGQVHGGFILHESGDEVVLRNMAALTTVIAASQIKERQKDEHVSSMTPGLVNNLTPEQLADLIEYFRSLK